MRISLRSLRWPRRSLNVTTKRILPPQFQHVHSSSCISIRSFSNDVNNTSKETEVSSNENYSFQAETAKLLEIVTHSIYTEKDIFLRELISNASDALEKLRYMSQVDESLLKSSSEELKIDISVDENANKLIIHDNGIGMTKEEMIKNLGTIAKSGSKQFLENLTTSGETSTKENIIGQFGVGFYSAFMVSDSVDVYSRSSSNDSLFKWSSKGSGNFSISEISSEEISLKRGTRIEINLKEDALDYLKAAKLKEIINERSRFVSFPIFVEGEKVNTVEALWLKQPSQVKDEEYEEFYKYQTKAFDKPLINLHFHSDVPLDLKCLLFVPTFNMESLGTGQRLAKGVSLYSRKILIEQNSDKIVPDWLRFLRGTIDSEDLPISLSRESIQNSRLVSNIRDVVVKRFIRYLKKENEKNSDQFSKNFFKTYGNYIKEGICSDAKYINDLSEILRFNSSIVPKEEYTSFDEYLSRSDINKDKIYYLTCPNYEIGMSSPYLEIFKNKGIEVLFLYTALDEFAITNIEKYNGRELVSISSNVDMKLDKEEDEKETKEDEVSEKDSNLLRFWLKDQLKDVVSDVRISNRLKDTPALIVDHESVATRNMLRQVQQLQADFEQQKQIVEINVSHPIFRKISSLRESDEALAGLLSRQVFDNAMIAAGLIDDARDILPRLNQLLDKLIR